MEGCIRGYHTYLSISIDPNVEGRIDLCMRESFNSVNRYAEEDDAIVVGHFAKKVLYVYGEEEALHVLSQEEGGIHQILAKADYVRNSVFFMVHWQTKGNQ